MLRQRSSVSVGSLTFKQELCYDGNIIVQFIYIFKITERWIDFRYDRRRITAGTREY